MLLDTSFDINQEAFTEGEWKATPLSFMFAVKWSHFEAAKALLDAGADPNCQDRFGRTARHYILKKRSAPKYVRMLLEHGARLDLEDRDGVTAASMLLRIVCARVRSWRSLNQDRHRYYANSPGTARNTMNR